jgi:Big-like domain-containing protein
MYYKNKGRFFLLSLILISLVFTGCSKVGSKYSSDLETGSTNEKLTVLDSFPDNKVVDEFIPINSLITINFNNFLNVKTICYSNIFLTNEIIDPETQKSVEQKIPCSPITINSKDISFRPMQRLVANRIYTISITEYVKDENNNPFESLMSWTFMAKDIGRLRVKKDSEIIENGELTYNFGEMFKDASTENISFDLENFGSQTVVITSIILTGDDTQFTLSNTGIASIDSESSHKINIKFNPTAEGIKNCAIEIAYTDGIGADIFIINLTGEGLPAPDFQLGYLTNPADTGTFITLMPVTGEYDFGSIVLTKNSGEKTFAIKNTRSIGEENINITNIEVNNENFNLSIDPFSWAIAPEDFYLFTIDYIPDEVDSDETGLIQILSSDLIGDSYPVSLKGVCRNPEIDIVDEDSIAAGGDTNSNYYQGKVVQSIDLNLKIKNIGEGKLVITDDPVISDVTGGSFTITSGPVTDDEVAESGEVAITVTFVPDINTGGVQSAILTIKSDDNDESEYIVNLIVDEILLTAISVIQDGTASSEVQVGSTLDFIANGNYNGEWINVSASIETWSSTRDGGGISSVSGDLMTFTPNDRGDIVITAELKSITGSSGSFNAYNVGGVTYLSETFSGGSVPVSWTYVNGSGGEGWYGVDGGWAGTSVIGGGTTNPTSPLFSNGNNQTSIDTDGAYFIIPMDFTDAISDLKVNYRMCSHGGFYSSFPFIEVYIRDNGSTFAQVASHAHSDTGWHEWSRDINSLSTKNNADVKFLYDHYLNSCQCGWIDWITITGTGKIRH